MMRISPSIHLLLLGAVAFFLVAGCGGDDKAPTETPDEGLTAEEVETATTITDALSAVFAVGGIVSGAVRDALAHPGLAPANETLEEERTACPVVTVDAIGLGILELTLDYGSGCATAAGDSASGSLGISYHASASTDTIHVTFNSFSMEDAALDGHLDATGRGTAWVFVFDGTVTTDGTPHQIVATFALVVDLAGTPTDPLDDVTTITGGGTFELTDKIYEISITEPLVFHSDCNYPLTGKLTYQEQATHATPITTIDFTAGDCCTVRVSVGNKSQDLNLCTAS